jgi:hypothetical protein
MRDGILQLATPLTGHVHSLVEKGRMHGTTRTLCATIMHQLTVSSWLKHCAGHHVFSDKQR